MNKHTPRPWPTYFDLYFDTAYSIAKGDTRYGWPPPNVTDGEIEANARLMIAAPDLLEALESLLAINDSWNEAMIETIGRPVGWTDKYLDAARLAIKKAKGENVPCK